MVIRVCFLFTILLALLLTGTAQKANSNHTAETAQKADSLKERKVQFSYAATVQVPEGAKSASLWLPLPKSDANQDITDLSIKSDYPISFNTDLEYKNPILSVSVTNPKSGPLTVEYSFKAVRRENIHRPELVVKVSDEESADPLMPRWLQPDRLVPISDRIKTLAAEVTKDKKTDLEKVRAIYDYAVTNIKYNKEGTGWGRGDIYFVCDEKRGNCTDFHSLIIGLCRASGIPAAFEIGFPIPSDKPEGQIMGYHCWAKAYVKGFGWIPMDASEASKNPTKREYFFGAQDENRIQFSLGRDIRLLPQIHSDPVNFFIFPYAEINNQVTDKIERKVTYKAL